MIHQSNQFPDPASIADIIREPTHRLINQLAGIQLEQCPEKTAVDGPSIRFSITGEIRGSIVFIFESTLSNILIERLLKKMGMESSKEYHLEALGELGNILMGHIDGNLDKAGVSTTFSTPEVSQSKQDCPELSPVISIVLYSVDGAMQIDLYLHQD